MVANGARAAVDARRPMPGVAAGEASRVSARSGSRSSFHASDHLAGGSPQDLSNRTHPLAGAVDGLERRADDLLRGAERRADSAQRRVGTVHQLVRAAEARWQLALERPHLPCEAPDL